MSAEFVYNAQDEARREDAGIVCRENSLFTFVGKHITFHAQHTGFFLTYNAIDCV